MNAFETEKYRAMQNGYATSNRIRIIAGVMNTGPRNRSRSNSSLRRARHDGRASAATGRVPIATRYDPAMIFFISFSAHTIASFVAVPVTAFAIMLGRMYELVMSCTLSDGGAGQP